MKNKLSVMMLLIVFSITILLTACSGPQEKYNTQTGALIGAGAGAALGQAIGRSTQGTLIGAAVGTLLGAVVGNAVDQQQQAAREAYQTNKRVVYYDDNGGAVEAIPGPVVQGPQQSTNCKKVTKRVWNKGELVSETVEEICEGEKTSKDY